MRISISGKQIDVGAALQEYVKTGLEGSVSKYFPNAVSADVVVTKQRHLFSATIHVNEGTDPNFIVKATGEADEVHASFEKALERIEKQLRRYKKRIRNHHHNSQKDVENAQLVASKFVLASAEGAEEEESNEGDAPLIIAEKKTNIETLTVGDAVMRMDLADLPAYVFINKLNNAVNVVYRRADGNISWIDSGVEAGKTKSKSSAA